MGMSRALVLVAVAVLFLGRTVYAYRVQNSSQVKLPFAPYEQVLAIVSSSSSSRMMGSGSLYKRRVGRAHAASRFRYMMSVV